ncbi:MAG TPA: hypothetical protein VKP64_09435 [Mycobacteriales bacterium]|nr:hypothetical protein [Mycobacteriales bacterium]
MLELSSGVTQVQRTLDSSVVTDELRARFDEALGLIKQAVQTGSSKAAYLDGSFGAGKSHFMAVLHALLANRPEARAKADLAPLVDKYDALVTDHRFLLVPYHLIGKSSVEEAILGGYLAAVRRRHPDAPLPAVLADAPLLETARRLRKQFTDFAARTRRLAMTGTAGGSCSTTRSTSPVTRPARISIGSASCATGNRRTRSAGCRATSPAPPHTTSAGSCS